MIMNWDDIPEWKFNKCVGTYFGFVFINVLKFIHYTYYRYYCKEKRDTFIETSVDVQCLDKWKKKYLNRGQTCNIIWASNLSSKAVNLNSNVLFLEIIARKFKLVDLCFIIGMEKIFFWCIRGHLLYSM